MCVIAVKNIGTPMPTSDSIKSMWDTNSDGAGFMYMLNGKVVIEKGFMKLTDFTRALELLDKKLRKAKTSLTKTPVVLHFRITTHGGTSPQLTHPFPISSQEKHLKALDLTCDLGLVHNGIISSIPTQAGLSDTAVYIANVLSPLSNMKSDFYKSKEGKTIIENTIGASKFAFLDKLGNVELIGDFRAGTKDDTQGILFSNLNHEFVFSGASHLYQHSDSRSAVNFYADSTYTWDEFEDTILVKKLPLKTMIANSTNFFTTKDENYLKFSKIVTETDNFYIDKDSTIYTKLSTGRFIESRYYDAMLTISNNEYTYAFYEDLIDVADEVIKVGY